MTIEQHLAHAHHGVRLENAKHINRLRAAGVGCFAILIVGLTLILEGHSQDDWQTTLKPVSAYAILALLVMLGAEGHPKVLWLSRFAVPLFDIPMVWLTLHTNQDQWLNGVVNAGTISGFGIGAFLCVLLLSAFTLDKGQIYISFVMVTIAQWSLQGKAGMGYGGQLASMIFFGVAVWICLLAGKNRIKLVKLVTEEAIRHKRLQSYFSPGVGEILGQQDEENLALGRESEVTVIITDIRGFTALSEKLDSRETVKLLNLYHSKMVEAVFQYGGTLDKYLGDGLLAYFNAPIGQTDHAERAVQCALAMNCGLASLNTNRSWHGLEELQMGIGIHTGRAIVGDIGAPHRKEFTAIGQAVNVASRLESLTKELGHSVLVSKATADQVTDQFTWVEVGTFPIRGCAAPLTLFSPGTQERPPSSNN